MNLPQPLEMTPPASPRRRVFDLLVIVVIACGLLGWAWQVARERGRVAEAPRESSLTGATPSLPESPQLQLLLPLEKFGMVLTRQHVEGSSEQALAALDQRCREVLASADEWVLSLAVSPEEQQLLDSLAKTEPLSDIEAATSVVFRSAKERPFAERQSTLPGPSDPSKPSAHLFPLTQPSGRAGVRDQASRGGSLTPALSPTMESSQSPEPNVGAREQKEQSPKAATDTSAVAGRRLICWGFIVSDGAEGHTVWFAQPREKVPRSVLREGHAP